MQPSPLRGEGLKARGGKRYRTNKVTPGGSRPREPYLIEVVEVYMRIEGKKHSSTYSIATHGLVGAHALADKWLELMRAKAAEADPGQAAA